MKKSKFLSLLLVFVMLLTCSVNTITNVFAVSPSITMPTITVANAKGNPGDQVSVTIALSNNPGVCSIRLAVKYDSKLTLTAIDNGDIMSDYVFGKQLTANPYYVTWDESLADNDNIKNGTLVTLTFKISDSAAAGELPISVSYRSGEIYNLDLDDVDFETVDGGVNVSVEGDELPDLDIDSVYLTLQDSIVVNCQVSKEIFADGLYSDPYMIFTFNGKETKVDEYKIVDDYYIFSFKAIAPHQMNDPIQSVLFAKHGDELCNSTERVYSVATYCYSLLEQYTGDKVPELRTLLVDLLEYGAKSQAYMGYKTESLVTSQLTNEQRNWGTSIYPELDTVQNTSYETIDNPAVIWAGAGLNLLDSITMRFKIACENIDGLTAIIRSESGRQWAIPFNAFEEVSTGRYYVFFDGLNAGQMRESLYITIYKGETPVSNTLIYSIESYAYAKSESNDDSLNALLIAMMKYGDSAYAFAH